MRIAGNFRNKLMVKHSGADGFRRAEPEAHGPGSRVGTTERRREQVCYCKLFDISWDVLDGAVPCWFAESHVEKILEAAIYGKY
jgi:hypothetical protein